MANKEDIRVYVTMNKKLMDPKKFKFKTVANMCVRQNTF